MPQCTRKTAKEPSEWHLLGNTRRGLCRDGLFFDDASHAEGKSMEAGQQLRKERQKNATRSGRILQLNANTPRR